MNIEDELKGIESDDIDENDNREHFIIVFNRNSDRMKYMVSKMFGNRYISRKMLDGSINIKFSKNNKVVITGKL